MWGATLRFFHISSSVDQGPHFNSQDRNPPPSPPPAPAPALTTTLNPLGGHNAYPTAMVNHEVQVQPLHPPNFSFLPSTAAQEQLLAATSSTTLTIMVHQNPITSPNLNDLGSGNSRISTIAESLRTNELGKLVLMMSVPMAVGLFTISNNSVNAPAAAMHAAAVSLAIGFVGIWNGILLRGVMEQASNVVESMGIAFMLLSFFSFIACFLPQNLIWIPTLCWLLSIAVFGLFLAASFPSRGKQNQCDLSADCRMLSCQHGPYPTGVDFPMNRLGAL